MPRLAPRRPSPPALVAAAVLALGLAWWWAVPPWEAPDGIWHWHFASHLADGGGLPRSVDEARDAPWRQEGSQPPLYYALVALAVAPLDRSDAATAMRDNPHAAVGVAATGGNANRVIHPPRERFPWHGVARAARVAGLVSLALALAAVAATHAAARRLLPHRPDVALAAAATVGLSPATLFFGTQVSNDIAALAAGAGVLWAAARVVDGGVTARRAAVLGAACGVALLAKLNGLFLLPAAAVALAGGVAGERRRAGDKAGDDGVAEGRGGGAGNGDIDGDAGGRGDGPGHRDAGSPDVDPNAGDAGGRGDGPRKGGHKGRPYAARPVAAAGAFAAAWAAVAGWWPLRNLWWFGDPTGLPLMWAAMPRRAEPPGMAELLGQLGGVWKSVWAVFGWYNLPAPAAVFVALAVAQAVGVVGAVVALRRGGRRERWAVGLAAVAVASLGAGVVLWARVQYPQGRLLFPAVPALAVLFAIGWGEVGRRLGDGHIWPWLVAAAWSVLSAGLLVSVVRPAYRPQGLIEPCCAIGIDTAASFGHAIRLSTADVGVMRAGDTTRASDAWPDTGSTDPSAVLRDVHPGDTLAVRLLWSARAPITRDLSVYLHLIDADGLIVAQEDSAPASGRWPTSAWPVSRGLIDDRHLLVLPPTTAAPCDCTLVVGVYDPRTGERVAGTTWHPGPPGTPVAPEGFSRPLPPAGLAIARVALERAVGPDGVPSPMRVQFGDAIELVGYDLPSRRVAAGDALPLTLYWRAAARSTKDVKVSIQLRRGAAETWGQRDEAPADGARPTSGWRRGEVVADPQPVPVYADAPPGAYTLYVKLYDPATGAGLSVDAFGHELALAPVRVVGR